MSNLVKATLQKVLADEAETGDGVAFPVQFNPSSLKIRITNQIEGGRSAAKQVRQQTGNSSRVLTMELIFDTADEGSKDSPVSVRQKTKQLEQFISTPENNPDPPPKLKFNWGDLTVVGIANSIDVSLEHFAANGYPLRAKVNLSIKEQDPTIVFTPADRGTGNAQNPGAKASLPGAGTNSGFSAGISAGIGLSAGIGISAGVSAGFGVSAGISAGVGISAGAKVGFALEGEMGAEFAARMGVDPAAWRSLDVGADTGGNLAAGSQVVFNTATNISPGIGVSSGVNAESDVNQKASSGLNLSTVSQLNNPLSTMTPQSKNDADSAGKAISSLGGIGATINGVKLQNSQQQTQLSVSAFGINSDLLSTVKVLGGNAVDQTGKSKGISRAPLVRAQNQSDTQMPNEFTQTSAFPDQRAMTYGQGIPLEPLFGVSQTQNVMKVYADRDLAIANHPHGVPFTSNAATPPWVALPQRDAQRQAVDSKSPGFGNSSFSTGCQCTGVTK
ncbi:hypothetical protein AB6T38_02630 [Aliiglaciecola sp. SL4]|uniref:CIS tube protein n=1 Tax=Aliiglaciecola sp. SL4 TaxID=3239806 RepID=UPI00355BD018